MLFDLKLGPSPRESRHGVPDGMTVCRCGAVDDRLLKFPDDETIAMLAKEELECEIVVELRYDTCIIFWIPQTGHDKEKIQNFVQKLTNLLNEIPENQVRKTTRDLQYSR